MSKADVQVYEVKKHFYSVFEAMDGPLENCFQGFCYLDEYFFLYFRHQLKLFFKEKNKETLSVS